MCKQGWAKTPSKCHVFCKIIEDCAHFHAQNGVQTKGSGKSQSKKNILPYGKLILFWHPHRLQFRSRPSIFINDRPLACLRLLGVLESILRSRGDNFLFKNVEIFKIHQKFAEIGWFEYGNVPENPKPVDFVDFPLHSLYIAFTV